jgi:hypothetical protein
MGAISGDFSRKSQLAHYLSSTPRTAFRIFALLVAAAMLWAWSVRDYRYLEAESGAGYALGIIGASLMVVLLLYPLRKRLRFMRGWLNLKSWFRLHMVLGVLGPLCILLHCNFNLGSTNSNVALASMLLVAGSGLIGRYLYGKFHFGLYGQQVGLQQLKTDLDYLYQQLETSPLAGPQRDGLRALYDGCVDIIESQRAKVSFRQLIGQRRWLRRMTRQALAGTATDSAAASARQQLDEHRRALAAVLDKLAGLRLFERLFGLWHVIHIPVFLLMIVTAIVHIFVVHWY